MTALIDSLFNRPNFLTFTVVFLWGFYIMVTRFNLIKKLVGLYLVQTSVIFFLVSVSAKEGATVPILQSTTDPVEAMHYVNPLPHVLTLTAIVVGVATLGVALAIASGIYRLYGSLDEEDILKKLE